MRSLTPIELKSDEYFLVTDRQLLYKVEGNNEIQNIRFADQKLHLKGIDTNSFWYTMNNTGRFTVIVPDKYVSGLEISEKHLIADTKEDTTSKLEEKIKTDLNHLLVTKNDDNETIREYYRVNDCNDRKPLPVYCFHPDLCSRYNSCDTIVERLCKI